VNEAIDPGPLIDDPDIFRAAKVLIYQHVGSANRIQATMQVARQSADLGAIDLLLKFDFTIHDNVEVDPT